MHQILQNFNSQRHHSYGIDHYYKLQIINIQNFKHLQQLDRHLLLQSNMNHPIFFRILRGENIFKISDKLKSFDIEFIPNRKIVKRQYECKKTLKTITPKTTQQTYILTTITDESFIFFQIKQLNSQKPSTFTLAQKQFLQKKFLRSLFGEIKQISCHEYLISGYRWDGFVIQFGLYYEDLFFFVITNEMISPILKRQDPKEFQIKIKQGFEEILSRIINQKKANQLIQYYLQDLKKTFNNHPELLSNTQETEKLVNFNLLKYALLCETSYHEEKAKLDEDKREKSHPPMEIQK